MSGTAMMLAQSLASALNSHAALPAATAADCDGHSHTILSYRDLAMLVSTLRQSGDQVRNRCESDCRGALSFMIYARSRITSNFYAVSKLQEAPRLWAFFLTETSLTWLAFWQPP